MPNFFKHLNPEPLVSLLGTIAVSIAAQPIITTAINTGAKKVSNNTPYPQGVTESITSPLMAQVQQSGRIMKRRLIASMLPAVVSQEIAKDSTISRLAVNSLIETVIGSLMEPREKFNAANSKQFPMAVDLSKINREEFFKSTMTYQPTRNYGEAEWNKLENRQKTFQANFPTRSLMLLCRNTAFCAASVGAGPLGKEFARDNVELFEKIGLSQKQAELVSTMIFRSGFACLTTPFDSLVTKLSSGELPARQIMKEAFQHLKHGRLAPLFIGATARTILSTTTSTTVATGPDVGKSIEELCSNFTKSFSENPLQKILSGDQNPSEELARQVDYYFLQLSEKIGAGVDVTDDVVQTLEIIKILPEETSKSVIGAALSMQNIGEMLGRAVVNAQSQSVDDSATPSISNLQPIVHDPLAKPSERTKGND